ncbi:MAG: Na+/H+ antiporter subunit E [Rhodospirillales bacterium]|nr:Na+/H+ antiporter subunit E [Rhodospirillales bacterium]
MTRAVSLGLAMAALWLLLSGYFDKPLLLAMGAVSVVLVVLLSRHMDVVDHEGHPVHLSLKVLAYWPWLLKEIVVSSIDVAKVILAPSLPIAPAVFTVRGRQRTELGRVIFANSITLTPGTVTIALDGEELTVYALTAQAASGWEDSEMNRRVAAIEAAT